MMVHNMQNMQTILAINTGSSTIKFSIFNIEEPSKNLTKIYTGLVDKVTTTPVLKIKATDGKQVTTVTEKKLALLPYTATATTIAAGIAPSASSPQRDPYEYAIHEILAWLAEREISIVAAGHRVVHGSTRYRQAVVIDDEIVTFLASLSHLAPLHQPYNLKGYEILHEEYPSILQVACFDTSFHTTCNELSQRFAIPQYLAQQGVQRYGFHGLSYEYVVSQFERYLPADKIGGKVIIAHLGQGTSMCAVHKRASVATTLSFSALDGLPMGTRCGNIDPGVLLHLMTYNKMDAKQIETLLYKESGLLGLSGGISSDMRVLLASSHPDAKLAIDVFVYKTGAWIGMLAAELQGLDALVFTAGIGENAAYVREQICERAEWLGVKIDKEKNDRHAATISAAGSKVTVHVIPTDEELMIAQDTLRCFTMASTSL